MPTANRLEDRIRTLSEKLVKAEGKEFHRLAVELRTAITEHIERIRVRLAQYPVADDSVETFTLNGVCFRIGSKFRCIRSTPTEMTQTSRKARGRRSAARTKAQWPHAQLQL